MDAAELETYLRERIPLSRAMEVRVVEIGAEHLRVAAPLAPNINHRDTVFGGSAAAAAMLAAWGLLYVRLHREQRPARLVIQRCTMEFLQPIDAGFAAVSTLAAARTGRGSWQASSAKAARALRCGSISKARISGWGVHRRVRRRAASR